VEDHDALANLKLFDARADCGDGTRSLMAEDAWRGVRAGMNLLEIRAADAACVDLD